MGEFLRKVQSPTEVHSSGIYGTNEKEKKKDRDLLCWPRQPRTSQGDGLAGLPIPCCTGFGLTFTANISSVVTPLSQPVPVGGTN